MVIFRLIKKRSDGVTIIRALFFTKVVSACTVRTILFINKEERSRFLLLVHEVACCKCRG